MPLPFDATLKEIVQAHVADFEREFRLTGPEPVTVLNVDLSTVSAATDVALGYGDPLEKIDDLNFQSSHDAGLPARVLLYSSLLHHRFGVPVHSMVVLLRPAADSPDLTGKLHYQARKRRGKMDFSFEVVRLWQRPVRRILQGGLGTLPLAPLCQMPEGVSVEEALPGIIRQMQQRRTREAAPEDSVKLLSAAYVLAGLRTSRSVLARLFQGVTAMRESTTYQGILEEGRIEALHKTILRQGRIRFGAPGEALPIALEGITDGDRLERLTERLLLVSSWDELMATP